MDESEEFVASEALRSRRNVRRRYPDCEVMGASFISRNVDWKLLVIGISIVLAAFGLKDKRVPLATVVPNDMAVDEVIVVKRVIDGDTIELEGGQKARYIGINSPELSEDSCFGKEALEKNRQLVEGKIVRLQKDISETDKYGRLLRYVWVDDVFVNEVLVQEGFAQVSTYPPDVLYKDVFLAAEKQARIEMVGLWGSVCAKAR